ncbi:MAG: O-antigen ligase family protein [Acidobacteriota bacterium]
MSKPETGIRRIVFGLFLLLIFSLGIMKPSAEMCTLSLTPTDLIFPFVFVCWFAALTTGYYRFKRRAEFLAFALYFLALAISSIFSINPGLSFIKLTGHAYLILLAIMSASIVTSFGQLKLSLLAWVAGSLLPIAAALIGIIFFYFWPESGWLPTLTYHYGAVPVGNFPRISSTFVSPSMFCNYLTVTLILTLVSARLKWIGTRLAVAIVFAIAVAAIFTVSIALGGIILAAGFWLSITCSNKLLARVSLVFGGGLALVFLAIAPFALSLGPGTSFFDRLIPSSRFLVWSDALNTFLSDPLTGNGVGTAVANVVFQNYDGSWSLLTDAHNIFLSVAAQSGIPGLLAMIAIIIVMLNAALSASNGPEENNYIRRSLAIAFFVPFVYEGLTGSFEDARHLWVLMGLILAAKSIRDELPQSISMNGV